MRLLLLISSLDSGGAETHFYALASRLRAEGYQVVAVSSGGKIAEALTEDGVAHYRLPLHRKDPISLARSYWGLGRLLRRGRFDLIHAHARIPAYLVRGMAKRRGIPLVTTAHARFRSGWLWRRLSAWGDRTIAVSEDIARDLERRYGVPRERIVPIPNGVDTRRFSPKEGERSDKPRLVFLSRLDEDCSRGAFLLCDLAERLAKRIPELEIVIGGGGSCLAQGRALAARINRCLGRSVISFLGRVDDPVPLFRSAHAVLGVSRVALEAMACGVPVILGGDEGFLGLAEGEVLERADRTNFCGRGEAAMEEDALLSAILSLFEKTTEERERIGREGREYVRRFHSLEDMVAQTREVYGEVLARKERVLLCGYYGYGNMGDDALLSAAIKKAKARYGEREIVALTRRGRRDSASFGVRCVSRRSLWGLRREIGRAHALIFGGGTLLQEDTSLRSLFYYTFLLRYAQGRGVKTELWANGLGMPRTRLGERWMQKALGGCGEIGLRDGRSYGIAQSLLGGEDKLRRQRDLAEGITPVSAERVRTLLQRVGLLKKNESAPTDFVVVALRGRSGKGYLRILREWLTVLRAEGYSLLFVPMLPREDGGVTQRFCREQGGEILEGVSPEELTGVMREARLVCSMRLHGLVFASSVGTPFVGFGGEEKIECFCRENGGVYFTELY